MEAKRRENGRQSVLALGIALLVAAAVFVASILASSALIFKGVLPLSGCIFLLYVSVAAETFGASVFLALAVRRQLLLQALLVQGIFLPALLLAGALMPAAAVNWVQFGISVAVAAMAALLAILAFGGRKKKKIQKNSTIRLKKK